MRTIDADALRHAAVIESSDDAIISHTLDGVIETWNRAAERMFGYTASEAIGRHIDLLVPPERRSDEEHVIERLRRGEDVRHFESVARTRTGATLPVSIAVSTVRTPDGQMIGIARVVRDLSWEKTLEREALRLAAIVDSSEDAIVSKDLNGIVMTWNKAAERMFGYTADEMIGRPISVIIPAERLGEEDDVLARIRAGINVEHFDTVRRRKDGSFIEISLSVSPIKTPNGIVIGASKIARDVTVERQLARAAADANRVKDEFLATLSHELRTPLNAVVGYTHMLRTGQFGEGQQEHAIEAIERNAHTLTQLVSDILDISTIVTGKVRLKITECDFNAMIGAAIDIVRPSADAKGVTLHVERPEAPLSVRCDGDRMQQVFWNLLSNAVKFTPRGGRIEVGVVMSPHVVTVTVADTGIGMAPETVPHVFQRFWQGENSGKSQIRGLGLGLALARHFVELHGGTISAASAGEGQGSTFTLTLPRRAD